MSLLSNVDNVLGRLIQFLLIAYIISWQSIASFKIYNFVLDKNIQHPIYTNELIMALEKERTIGSLHIFRIDWSM